MLCTMKEKPPIPLRLLTLPKQACWLLVLVLKTYKGFQHLASSFAGTLETAFPKRTGFKTFDLISTTINESILVARNSFFITLGGNSLKLVLSSLYL